MIVIALKLSTYSNELFNIVKKTKFYSLFLCCSGHKIFNDLYSKIKSIKDNLF